MKKLLISAILSLSILLGSMGGIFATTTFTDYSQDLGYGALNTHWASNDINYIVSLGAIKGIPNNSGGISFEANREITRSEFATILIRLLDPTGVKTSEALQNTDITLSDMQSRGFTWEAETMATVHYYGGTIIAKPTPEEWNKNITRAEMAYLTMYLSEEMNETHFDYILTDIEHTIKDNNIVENSPWAVLIYKAYYNGIIVGDENGNFNPNNNATRAEVCTILARLIDPTRRIPLSTVDSNGSSLK